MRSASPRPILPTAFPAPEPPLARVLTRQEAYERILRLCEMVLWRMALRRMH